jgi:hypothetical protein
MGIAFGGSVLPFKAFETSSLHTVYSLPQVSRLRNVTVTSKASSVLIRDRVAVQVNVMWLMPHIRLDSLNENLWNVRFGAIGWLCSALGDKCLPLCAPSSLVKYVLVLITSFSFKIIQLMPVPAVFTMTYGFEPCTVINGRNFYANESLVESESCNLSKACSRG